LIREIIRVEPLSSDLEAWRAPTSVVARAEDTIFACGLPSFDPETGEVINASIERQSELMLEQMKLCLENAGASWKTSSNATSNAPPSSISLRSMSSTQGFSRKIRQHVFSCAYWRGPATSISKSIVSRSDHSQRRAA
jgi:hypothetical protein